MNGGIKSLWKQQYLRCNSYLHILTSCKAHNLFTQSRSCVPPDRNLFTSRHFSVHHSKMSPTVYVTRKDVPQESLDLLKKKFEVEVWPSVEPIPKEELVKHVAGKDALYCLLTDKIDAQVLDAAGSNLKVIATMSTGYDHINVEEVRKRGIKIGYTPGILTDAVAELTVALLLATSRRLLESHNEILNGGWMKVSWSPMWMCGQGLSGSTVGIVGFGRIGQEVARRLKVFNVSQILYNSRTPKSPEIEQTYFAKYSSLDHLLQSSDFVIVLCSLTPETHHMFNEQLFSKMKPNAIFINTSRGSVVVQDDLIKALESGKIAAAGLDVMTPEPLPSDHPLLKMKNCVVLPHIGSATLQTRTAMGVLTANNIIAALEDKEMPSELK